MRFCDMPGHDFKLLIVRVFPNAIARLRQSDRLNIRKHCFAEMKCVAAQCCECAPSHNSALVPREERASFGKQNDVNFCFRSEVI
jgi:hypothetical protein